MPTMQSSSAPHTKGEGAARTLVIRGGTVVDVAGRYPADVMIGDGSIVSIQQPGNGSAAEEIDASGLLVLPGLVDAHVHVRDPGFPEKEDFETAGRAAARGGITTIVAMPYDNPLASSGLVVERHARLVPGRCRVDVAFTGAVGSVNTDAVDELAAMGAVSVEVMLSGSPAELGAVRPSDLFSIMRRAERSGLVVGVFCYDDSIVANETESARVRQHGMAAHLAAWPPVAEHLGVSIVCDLAEESGAKVHLRQISTAGAVARAQAARRRGADVTVEVNPHHLSLTDKDAAAAGPKLKVVPPLRPIKSVKDLQQAFLTGSVDVVGTDHAPHALAEKDVAPGDVSQVPGGIPGLETMLPVLLTTFGADRAEDIVAACATRPADRFGIAKKGRVLPGYDADLVLVDPHEEWVVGQQDIESRAGYSAYAGRRLRGRVKRTLVAGQTVFDGHHVQGEPRGRWLRRDSSQPGERHG